MSETGPIYGVTLIDVLPLNYGKPSGMKQAMPSRNDLEHVRSVRLVGDRVVAGYEVLLSHYLCQQETIAELLAAAEAAAKILGEFSANFAAPEVDMIHAAIAKAKGEQE